MESININPIIHFSWKEELQVEFNSQYFSNLKAFLMKERKNVIFFSEKPIFNGIYLRDIIYL